MRIGMGYDVHRFEKGRRLVLAGVEIPYEKGMAGHSDADVAVHALIDSILGAAALGDIGKLFPDSDARFKDIDSMLLLKKAVHMIKEQGFAVGNVDITIVAEYPKVLPYIDTMRERLASALEVEINQVSVKATTTEGLGFTGREEGIAAYAVCMLGSAFSIFSDR